MHKLTIDQRAARQAKMRNKRTRQELPLLAAQDAIPADWLTTIEDQKTRLEKLQQGFEAWWAGFLNAEEERRIMAERMKAEVRELVDDEEKFSELERGAWYTLNHSPVYALDYWHRILARLDQKYCPHAKNGHVYFRAGETCPVCLQVKQ